MDIKTGRKYKELCTLQGKRIKELDMLRAGVRVSLIACRAAVQKGGEVTEEILTELIDELKGGGA